MTAPSLLSFDLETHLIQPGLLAPPICCASWATRNGSEMITDLTPRESVMRQVETQLGRGDTWVGANIAYDFACVLAARPDLMPLIWRAYEEGRVHDVQIAATLNAIAEGRMREGELYRRDGSRIMSGRYSLDECVKEWLGRENAKENDRFRLSYALLEHLPIDQWPEDARQYPIDDAVNTLLVAEAQLRPLTTSFATSGAKNLCDLKAQCHAAFAIHLGAVWGLRTDPVAVEKFKAEVGSTVAAIEDWAIERGLMYPKTKKPKADGTFDYSVDKKALGELVLKAYGGNPPHTDKGGISTSRETLEDSGDPVLEKFVEVNRWRKFETYIPTLEEAARVPLNVKPNVLLSTGRVSYEGLIQLMPRKGGVRETFIARPGYVWSSVDYAAIEGCTLAQVCYWLLGYSTLGDAINEDKDIHSILGANLVGITYEKFVAEKKGRLKDVRQGAKIGNFGYPGMMGATKFVVAQKRQGTKVCELFYNDGRCGDGSEGPGGGTRRVMFWQDKPLDAPLCERCLAKAEEIRSGFISTWKEIRPYWSKVSAIIQNDDAITQFVSKRVRGKPTAPAAANTLFQGLAADGAKRAVVAMTKEMYLDTSSPLYGSRLVNFSHDETIIEIPEEKAHEAATRQAEVMIQQMRTVVPDVLVKAEPALMRRWFKGAEAVYVDGPSGKRLVPWEPKKGKE